MAAEQGQGINGSSWNWFGGFLRDELAPYPGRWAIVARMTIAATAVAIVCMTFRIPFGYQGAAYALIVSHETLENNWKAAFRIVVGTLITTAYVVASATLVAGNPPIHFVWNIASFFMAFFCISAMREYAMAVPVAVVIGSAVTYWDRPQGSGTNLDDTLWLCLASAVSVLLTAAVSAVFAAFSHRANLIDPLAHKLRLVEETLNSHAEGKPVNAAIRDQLDDAVLAGTSSWRVTLRRTDPSRSDRDRLSAVGSLIARLVDIVGALADQSPSVPEIDPMQAARLAGAAAVVRGALLGENELKLPDLGLQGEASLALRQIAETLESISRAWNQPNQTISSDPDSVQPAWQIFAPDAFTNP